MGRRIARGLRCPPRGRRGQSGARRPRSRAHHCRRVLLRVRFDAAAIGCSRRGKDSPRGASAPRTRTRQAVNNPLPAHADAHANTINTSSNSSSTATHNTREFNTANATATATPGFPPYAAAAAALFALLVGKRFVQGRELALVSPSLPRVFLQGQQPAFGISYSCLKTGGGGGSRREEDKQTEMWNANYHTYIP